MLTISNVIHLSLILFSSSQLILFIRLYTRQLSSHRHFIVSHLNSKENPIIGIFVAKIETVSTFYQVRQNIFLLRLKLTL